jgi:hypothetical protein
MKCAHIKPMMPSRRRRAYTPDPDAPEQNCDAPGCILPGEYRAPKSRTSLREFQWFCLGHVQEFNSSWDYYKGMSPGEIESQLRADASWQRPSWPLGRLGKSARCASGLEDELHAFTFASQSGRRQPAPSVPPELREALDVLGLVWPVSMNDLKAKYKKLAKLHHPDANGGDKKSEEILKSINLAYATLRSRLTGPLAQTAHPAAE